MNIIRWGVLVGSLGIAVGACGDAPGICSSGELTAALAAAAPGDVVEIGACRVEGRFTVGAGVTLRGVGPESILASAGTAIELAGDGATLDALRIEHGGGHGIVAMAAGAIAIRHVAVDGTLGRAAIGIDGPSSVLLQDVTVGGPVTREAAGSVPADATATDTLLYGIVLVGVDDARFERVSVSGFGEAGVVSMDSALSWTGGDVGNNLGIGVWVNAGQATLRDLTIHDTLRGFRMTPTYGLIGRAGADVQTMGLTVSGSHAGFGLVQEGGTARHTGLISEHHDYGAVLAQRTTTFELTGASEIRDNNFAGMIAVEAGGLTVEDTAVTTTSSMSHVFGDWGSVIVGDGIQLVHPMAGTQLRRVSVDANERAGILLDLAGGDASSVTLTEVSANSAGAGLGCVAQNGSIVAGWDSGLVRSGAALANDPGFTGHLDSVGIIGPSDLPLSTDLAGIIGPSD